MQYTYGMDYQVSDQGEILVIPRGKEVLKELADYAAAHTLQGAWIQGIGGAERVTIGFYDIASKVYHWRTITEPLEILSLHGNLAWVDEKPVWHIHGTFSGADFQVIGGHVKELVVGLTCELLVVHTAQTFTRAHDDETGLQLLRALASKE